MSTQTLTKPDTAGRPSVPGNGTAEQQVAAQDTRTSRPRFAWAPSPALIRSLVQRLSRLLGTATIAICALIALGIVLYALDANTRKWLVSDIESIARWFAAPFANTFMVHSHKLAIALNWGLAIGVYAIVGRLAAGIVKGLPERLKLKG
jgi:hypothetical protein